MGNKKKYRTFSKKNPWRNTRNDKSIPWREIGAFIFMLLIPLIIMALSSNFVMRSNTFYSFFMSRTEVIKEIPYSVEKEDIEKTISGYMQHKNSNFYLNEKEGYRPQPVFSKEAANIMEGLRLILDILLIVGVIALLGATAIFIWLVYVSEKDLVFNRFLDSIAITGALIIGDILFFTIKPVRELVFTRLFGVKFPPGDVLIQILDKGLVLYFLVFQIITCLLMLIVVSYIVYKFASRRKMFRKVEL